MVHTKIGTFFVRLQGGETRWGVRGVSESSEATRWILQDRETNLLGKLLGLLQLGFSPVLVLLTEVLLDQRVQDGGDHELPAGEVLWGDGDVVLMNSSDCLWILRLRLSSPVSSSPCRGDTGACGPSSAPDSSCRRCGRMVSSRARKTTCGAKGTSLLREKMEPLHPRGFLRVFTSCRENTQNQWGPADLWENFGDFSLWKASSLSFLQTLRSSHNNVWLCNHKTAVLAKIHHRSKKKKEKKRDKHKVFQPCFLYLLLPLSTRQGSVSDTESFLFSRLAFSWSPNCGAEQTLFRPSSPQAEPCMRREWARLRPGRSRLSQRFVGERGQKVKTGSRKHESRKVMNFRQWFGTSWFSGWPCAEAARLWCCLLTGLRVWTSSDRWLLPLRWGDVLYDVCLRPTLTFSPAGESRSHRICKKKNQVNQLVDLHHHSGREDVCFLYCQVEHYPR